VSHPWTVCLRRGYLAAPFAGLLLRSAHAATSSAKGTANPAGTPTARGFGCILSNSQKAALARQSDAKKSEAEALTMSRETRPTDRPESGGLMAASSTSEAANSSDNGMDCFSPVQPGSIPCRVDRVIRVPPPRSGIRVDRNSWRSHQLEADAPTERIIPIDLFHPGRR
jgi:hypothetical protein